jgi:hypothetical protein
MAEIRPYNRVKLSLSRLHPPSDEAYKVHGANLDLEGFVYCGHAVVVVTAVTS